MNSCSRNPDHRSELSRAQSYLLGQLAGDALGSLIECQSPEDICCS
ncbi:ADP-ribosylglycohydrolase family protein [Desulfopila sp. IMCC35006]|nr:ADP-ribosylglycohydrolase family protein [Desulfopila sp. IMCC35006]